LQEAKTLNDAFSPLFSITREWLPMRELRQLDNTVKYETAVSTYEAWKAFNDEKKTEERERLKSKSPKTKLLSAFMLVSFGYCALASFVNIPPASYITELTITLFKTDSYYPMLNAAILILATAGLFRLIDKNVM
jgi:hypothetical protein